MRGLIVGDKVSHEYFGDGEVLKFEQGEVYPLVIFFSQLNTTISFKINGESEHHEDGDPILTKH